MNSVLRSFCVVPIIGLTALLAAAPAGAEPERYEIDPEHLSIGFLVMHIGYAKTLGMFREGSGSFSFDEDAKTLSDVSIVIETASVFTNHDKRDGHLSGKDFLNVKKFPQMTFTAAGAKTKGDRQFAVSGELTVIGKNRPVTLEFTWNKSDTYPFGPGGISPPYVIGLSARGSFKRSEFGMKYAVDNGWVGDDVELIIEFEARQQ